MDNLYNVNQAAFIMKVHPLTVRRYIKESKLVAVKLGGNIRIREKDLNNFMKSFTPEKIRSKKSTSKRIIELKEFTTADPFLKLKGRAATVDF